MLLTNASSSSSSTLPNAAALPLFTTLSPIAGGSGGGGGGGGHAPKNASLVCLHERDLLMTTSELERFTLGVIVPPLILFGLVGNLINLSVLMGPGMQTRSNRLLAALAFADMLFLLLMLPNSLVHYHFLFMNNVFRLFYFLSHIHLLALVNWTSAAGIWFVLFVCLERLIGIKYPLSVRKQRQCRTKVLIVGIIAATGVLTLYQHFSYTCFIRYFCHDTQIHSFCYAVDSEQWLQHQPNPHSNIRKLFAKWSLNVHAFFVVFIPTVVIIVANGMLILTVRKREHSFARATLAGSVATTTTTTGSIPAQHTAAGDERRPIIAHHNHNNNHHASSASSASPPTEASVHSRSSGGAGSSSNGNNEHLLGNHRIERKVTITVCAIVTCFTITQTPSAVVLLATHFVPGGPTFVLNLRTLTFTLVVLGKSLNFLLFCLSSENFRVRLRQKLEQYRRRRKSLQSGTQKSLRRTNGSMCNGKKASTTPSIL